MHVATQPRQPANHRSDNVSDCVQRHGLCKRGTLFYITGKVMRSLWGQELYQPGQREGMGKGTEKGRRLMALSLGYLSVKAGNWQYSAAEETHLGRCMQDEQPQTVQKNGHFWSEELCLEQEKDMRYKVLPAKDFLVLLKTHHYRLPVPTSSGNKESRLLGLTPSIAGQGDPP
ncbi:hypothetical protein Bbelb_398540 [Branchiostoma belcheri]|nr:hypothetical protein Bbelb_398540 [Branchiostoma belcheri]